ncbi:MAG: lysylphosphatidylglycerol synthase transmembrane domain-containing protein, partial [Asgard group archaeon]|nr:lysylphosphatidylglycerol synthase transmembrane domain-containing protein [Asgard group archaeon]
LIGTFGSSLTPAKVGDILRAFYLSKNNDEAKIGSTIFSVVFDRLLDLGGILIILLVSFPFLLTKVVFLDLSWWIFLGIVIGFVLFVIIIIFIFNKKFTRKIITFFVKFIARAFKKKSRQNKILIQTDDISNDFFVFQKKFKIRNYFFLTIFSVLFWIVLGFQGVFFLLAFGESTFQPLLISGILAIGALSAIAFPFSISGIGIRDTILRELFSKIMFISIHNALNLSILQTLVNVIFPGLLGGIVLIVRFVRTITRRNRQKTSEKQVPN